MFALMSFALVLSCGMAIDFNRAVAAHQALQAAVDSAALAVANSSGLTQAQRQTLASGFATSNNWVSAGEENNVTVTETESSNNFTVSAGTTIAPMFLGIVGVTSLRVSATATAQGSNNVCILALNATASPGFLANSGAVINAPSCYVDVASTGDPAAIFNSGDAFNVAKLCVNGADVLNNAGAISALQTSCPVPADPYASLPAVTVGGCDVSNMNYSGMVALSPGVYCGNFNFNGSGMLNLAPGVYVLRGVTWNLNSGWTINGTGVTFYFPDSSYIQINSGVTANLTAPMTGTYANILMFEASGLSPSSFTINGSAGHTLQGLIHLPSRNITFNSMSNVTADSLTIVVNTLILDNLNWTIQNSAYAGSSGGSHLTN